MVGLVADQIGPLNTYVMVIVVSGIVQLTIWMTAKSFAQICVFAVMYGLVRT